MPESMDQTIPYDQETVKPGLAPASSSGPGLAPGSVIDQTLPYADGQSPTSPDTSLPPLLPIQEDNNDQHDTSSEDIPQPEPEKGKKDEDLFYCSCSNDLAFIAHDSNHHYVKQAMAREDDLIKDAQQFLTTHNTPSCYWSRNEAHFVFEGPFSRDICFYIDLITHEAFRVDGDTDNLTEQEIIDNWPEVDQADRKEITQFVEQEVWKEKPVNELMHSPVDAIWVRKWKWKEKTG